MPAPISLTRGVANSAADFLELGAHHFVKPGPIAEDREVFLDLDRQRLAQLVADLVAAERGEAVEAQSRIADLDFREAISPSSRGESFDGLDQPDIRRDLGARPFPREQRRAGIGGRGGAADDRTTSSRLVPR